MDPPLVRITWPESGCGYERRDSWGGGENSDAQQKNTREYGNFAKITAGTGGGGDSGSGSGGYFEYYASDKGLLLEKKMHFTHRKLWKRPSQCWVGGNPLKAWLKKKEGGEQGKSQRKV